MKVAVEVPDDLVVMEGVLVVRGYREDGAPFWRAFPVNETPNWTMSDLCRRAHLKLEQILGARA